MSETLASQALEVGKKLVALCNEGKHVEAIDQLYSDNIVSIEAAAMPAMEGAPSMPQRMEGIDAIRGKNQWWTENHEVHGGEIKGPFPHGDRFTCFMAYDCTFKPTGQRTQMQEVALYTVKDGKIVQEEFFYDMSGCEA